MDDLLPDFLIETTESLAELDAAMLRLERAPRDQATLSLVFRHVHTIKGTCGFLGLPRLEAVAHAAETVLGRVRDGVLLVTPTLVSAILRALDVIRAIATGLGVSGAEPPGDDAGLIAVLLALAAGELPPETVEEQELIAPPEAAAAQSIRVAVGVLEHLMTLVSELVLARNQLLQIARTRDDSLFAAPLQRLSHITTDLQEGVMKTRMQPIGHAWAKLPRLVRDLSREVGKKIELVMEGQDTELDRQVLELIRDPLTHMIRNSLDHGIEAPEERRVAGKPETGRIRLSAWHEGGQIVIEINDDGRGLPLGRIRAKALSMGIGSEAELAAMSDAQTYRLILRPGFSTAAEITSVSGRGVGMDVVKTNVERIGGAIDLQSRPGEGTLVTIKIPLTLVIVAALIVEAAGERFAVPQSSVLELVHVAATRDEGAAATIDRIDGTPILRLRDRLLPLISLGSLLELPAPTVAHPDPAGTYIVVLAVGTSSLGMIVDRVFDTEEIVVKPTAPILRHITMFSGNTILGDGSVIMILDPSGIARATNIGSIGEMRNTRVAKPVGATSEDRTSLLLFRAGSDQVLAVPLGLVARLEHMSRERIEGVPGRWVTQYRGRLMPLVCVDPEQSFDDDGTGQPVLVFTEGGRSMGLVVDEILDVVTDRLHIELSSARAGVLGSAVIAGRATEILDTGYWLAQAGQDWFRPMVSAGGRPRLLAVEDSEFFRQMLVPTLAAAGYEVTTVDSAEEALALRAAGERFEVIVSDIEMAGLSGLSFAREVRDRGAWATTPMVALSGRASAADVAAGRAAGFTEYVAKLDRPSLISALQRCFHGPVGVSA